MSCLCICGGGGGGDDDDDDSLSCMGHWMTSNEW